MTDFASFIDMDLVKEHVAACSTLLDVGLPEASWLRIACGHHLDNVLSCPESACLK